MADTVFQSHETIEAFQVAGHWWRSLVGGIDDHQWDYPGIGEWTVRELVAHTGRAFKTIPEYIEGDVKDPTPIATAAEYFRIVLAEQTPHVHIANRARKEAGDHADWVGATDKLCADADLIVLNHSSDTPVNLFVGVMPLDQYLATRIVELVVHGLDLSDAIAIPSPPPTSAGRVAMQVLLDLSTGDDIGTILRLLTGRTGRLPLANVLA